MTDFKITGSYEFWKSNHANLEGLVEINKQGEFSGSIQEIESGSERKAGGYIVKDGPLLKLTFVTIPDPQRGTMMFYDLAKEIVGDDPNPWEGSYFGRWNTLTENFKFNPNYGLFVANAKNNFSYSNGKAKIELEKQP